MLFKRTFDPVHVIAVSIWHHGDNPIISGSRVAKKPIRDAAHHLTNVELAHRPLPRIATIHSSLSGHCDERKEGSRQFFGTTSAKPSPASPEDAVLDVSANRLSLSTRQRRSGERAAETRDIARRDSDRKCYTKGTRGGQLLHNANAQGLSQLLGALLDALAEGLRELPECAWSGCRGWPTSRSGRRSARPRSGPPAASHARYEANRKAAVGDTIEADPTAARVREIMAKRSTWAGAPPSCCGPGQILPVTAF